LQPLIWEPQRTAMALSWSQLLQTWVPWPGLTIPYPSRNPCSNIA
jgi:hypothetical protein